MWEKAFDGEKENKNKTNKRDVYPTAGLSLALKTTSLINSHYRQDLWVEISTSISTEGQD